MIFEKRILILEDDLRTVRKILERLERLEDRNPCTLTKTPKRSLILFFWTATAGLAGRFISLTLSGLGQKKLSPFRPFPNLTIRSRNGE